MFNLKAHEKVVVISNAIALIVTIIINYLSNTGFFNNRTVSDISFKYYNLITPASYAFAIWGLIYLSLIAFVIYCVWVVLRNKSDNTFVLQIGWWFVISCAANCLWILCWIYDYIGFSVLVMLILLIALIKIIFKTGMEIEDAPLQKIVFAWWPFSLYSGWITVAFIADIAAYLTKIQWNGFGISGVTWTIIMICAAGIINLLITWIRNMREFALVGCWALVAIAVANRHTNISIATTSIIVAIILLVSIALHGYKNRKNNAFIQAIKYRI